MTPLASFSIYVFLNGPEWVAASSQRAKLARGMKLNFWIFPLTFFSSMYDSQFLRKKGQFTALYFWYFSLNSTAVAQKVKDVQWCAIENHQDPFDVVNLHFSARPGKC